MHNYTDLTWKYLKQHKRRTILIIISIVVSISLFSSISTLILSDRDAQIENAKQKSGNYEVEYKQIDETKVSKIINNAEVLNCGIMQRLEPGKVLKENKNFLIDIKAYNKSSYDNVFKNYFDIKEGRLPLKDNEIAIENRALYSLSGKKLGDTISIEVPDSEGDAKSIKKEYEIVGTYEERFFSTEVFNGITFLREEAIKEKGLYNIFVNLKEKKDKVGTANELAKEFKLKTDGGDNSSQININQQLLSAEGLMNNSLFGSSNIVIMAILFGIIILCSAAVIYNAFNISVMERIKQFGILRSIGATPSQIRRIVFKEAFYVCLIAVPLGIITGYGALGGVLDIVRNSKSMDSNIIHIGFYPEVILICIVLAIITIAISVWSPARRAGKVSPIDAIKNINEIKSEEIKIRKGRTIKLLFSYEGELAYKNIRRTPKRFWFTVSSLIVSIALLIVYSNTMSIIKQQRDKNLNFSNSDAAFDKHRNNFTKEELNEIRNTDGIDKIYRKANNNCSFAFPKEYLNPKYQKDTGRPVRMLEGTDFVNAGNTAMSFYDDNGFEAAKKYLLDGKIDKNALNDMGVLLINKNRVIGEPINKEITADFSTYKVGDKIIVPKIKAYPFASEDEKGSEKPISHDEEMKKAIDNKEFYTFTVVGILDADFLGGYPQDGLGLVFTEEVYKKINGNLNSRSILIKYKDKEAREKLYEYFNKKASQIAGSYTDFYKLAEQERKQDAEANLFVYGFIGLIMLISAINIINTMAINVMLRKREFASLQAIGMTKQQLAKMILLEGLIHGLISAFGGIIIGAILTRIFIYFTVSDINLKLPYVTLALCIGISVLLTLAASIIPLKKLSKMNIVENLRME